MKQQQQSVRKKRYRRSKDWPFEKHFSHNNVFLCAINTHFSTLQFIRQQETGVCSYFHSEKPKYSRKLQMQQNVSSVVTWPLYHDTIHVIQVQTIIFWFQRSRFVIHGQPRSTHARFLNHTKRFILLLSNNTRISSELGPLKQP